MKGKNGIGSFISFPDRAEQPYMRLGEEVSRELGVDLYCISHALWGGALMKYE